MKKALVFLFATILFSSTIISCDKDKDDGTITNQDLIGKWEFSEYRMTKINGKDTNINANEIFKLDVDDFFTVTFNEDKTINTSMDDKDDEVMYWRIKEEGTKLETYSKKTDNTEYDKEEMKIMVNSTTFKILYNEVYKNNDLDDSGDFSFKIFDEIFKTNFSNLKEISVEEEQVFIKTK